MIAATTARVLRGCTPGFEGSRSALWMPPVTSVPDCQVRRYVMEDRFCAIRAAIGTAQARDVVVIAGKGNQDYQEYGDGQGGVIKACAVPG